MDDRNQRDVRGRAQEVVVVGLLKPEIGNPVVMAWL